MKDLLEQCTKQLQDAGERFPWTERRAYADWLVQTYYYVRHSTRLLATAAGRFAQDEAGDTLHHRFAVHIAEEKRHEQLALHDLKKLGFTLGDFAERHPTRIFYETQYYKIERQGPAVLFGYILPLEAIGPASGKRVLAAVTTAFGPKTDTFLRVHADEDEDHIQKALRLLELVSEPQRAFLATNLQQTTYAYCAILRDIVDHPA
jgi:thiaminase